MLYRLGQILIERKGSICSRYDPRDGQGGQGGAGDVQEAIDMTFYTAGEGRRLHGLHDAVRTPQQDGNVRSAAGWCLRVDHALEFSDGDSVVEDDAGADLRQYGCHQARRGYTAFNHQPRSRGRGGRRAAGVINVVIGTGEEAGAPLTLHARYV